MAGICLGNLEHEVLRSLVGNRCFAKAGLTVNDSVTQTVTVTIGAKQTDDVVTVTVNAVDYEYTVLVTDADNTAVADALATLIDADTVVSATNTAAVITILAEDLAVAYTVSAAVTGTNHTTTAVVATTHVSVQKVETDNAVDYSIDGKLYTTAATADIAVGGAALLSGSYRWYLVSINAAGTITCTPGVDGLATLPAIPASEAPIGAFKVTPVGVNFTPGTTALNATGVTTTYYDLACLPIAGVPA